MDTREWIEILPNFHEQSWESAMFPEIFTGEFLSFIR